MTGFCLHTQPITKSSRRRDGNYGGSDKVNQIKDHLHHSQAKLSTEPWPENGLERVEVWPVCQGTNRRVLIENLTDKIFGCSIGQRTMFQSQDCRLGYLDPRPTPETIGRAYETYYAHEAPSQQPISADNSQARYRCAAARTARFFVNGFRNRRYGSKYPDSSYLGGWLVQLIRPIAKYFDANARYLEKVSSNSPLVLDVGSGNGKFLHFAKDCGWTCQGLDFDQQAVESFRKKGLDVMLGTLDGFSNESAKFDMVTSAHVIEHVYSPSAMTSDMVRLLKPGGVLWLETPNIDALGVGFF